MRALFQVGPITYDLIWDREALAAAESFGDVCHRRFRIRVDPTYPKFKRDETIIHELLHAAEAYIGLKTQEREIRLLAMFLAQALQPYLDLPDPPKAKRR